MSELHIEVCYALKDDFYSHLMKVPEGTTIEDAIRHSGVLEEFPEIDLEKNKVGVFSEIRSLADLVAEGARIEIYRPLKMDPKEARRLRVEQEK
ncbi:MAG: RnfH family protein [Proteobacteria bacterium]|nr:RnfH family protein [Pseudomonadota bacterium]